ncbi:hypothetical protein AH4AK4_0879 [Aeromonas hydrophila 4AK4]|nr:hypothetical protein AH4AK4_0879 [Aeromonas hydrophila 4AK4]
MRRPGGPKFHLHHLPPCNMMSYDTIHDEFVLENIAFLSQPDNGSASTTMGFKS